MSFAVACGHAVTRDAARAVLEAGGSAVDAAIAGALAACAAEPVLAGLLGGGFLMLRDASGRTGLLDGFVDTPRRARPEHETDLRDVEADFGAARQAFRIGTGTIATPGLVPLLAEAHARHGRMPWAELCQPALVAAREGVTLTPFQAGLMRIVAPILTATPSARALHAPGGTLPEAGALVRNPGLADVIEVMALEGPRFVTEGEIAALLVELCREGGHLTRDDLVRYRPEWRTPLAAARGRARLSLNPAPAQGGTLTALLLRETPHGADAPAFARASVAVDRLRAGAARAGTPLAALLAAPAAPRGTTHLSVIDAAGMGAALTLSNGEGSGHVLPGTGIMPNNMLGEADLLPPGTGDGGDGGPDWRAWPLGMRLASMMAPAVIDWPDGRFALLGSGGSKRIATAMAQAILGLTDREMPLADAIAAPRLHTEPARAEEEGAEGPALDFEDAFPPREREALLAGFRGARAWPEPSMFFGGVHGALRSARGACDAAGDPRRDGAAATG